VKDHSSQPTGQRRVGAILFIIGVLLLLVAAGQIAMTWYARWQYDQAALAQGIVLPMPTPSPQGMPPATPPPPVSPEATPTTRGVQSNIPAQPDTPTPTPQPTTPAGPILARLRIPKLNLDAPIVPVPIVAGEWDVRRIRDEVGHLTGTTPIAPDTLTQPGSNIGLAGHVSLRDRGDGPFRWLEKLNTDDEIALALGEKTFLYRVTTTRTVPPDAIEVLDPAGEPTLTLITCTDWNWLKGEYEQRLVVTAIAVRQ